MVVGQLQSVLVVGYLDFPFTLQPSRWACSGGTAGTAVWIIALITVLVALRKRFQVLDSPDGDWCYNNLLCSLPFSAILFFFPPEFLTYIGAHFHDERPFHAFCYEYVN